MTAQQPGGLSGQPAMMVQAAPLGTLNEEAREVEVTFTTGDLVHHWVKHHGEFRRMPTRIVVEEGAIDLEFLKASGSVLDSHNAWSTSSVIGSVQDAWVQDGVGYARIRFASTEDVEITWQKVAQGILRNVSAGFEVKAQEVRIETLEDGSEIEVMYFTQIRVFELSMVGVPADKGSRTQSAERAEISVGEPFKQIAAPQGGDDASRADAALGTVQEQAAAAADEANQEETDMADQNQSAATPAPQSVDADAIRRQERERMSQIAEVGQQLNLSADIVRQAQTDGVSIEDFRAQAIAAFAEQGQRQTQGVGGPSIQITGDARDRFMQGATEGLMARAGLGGERNEFSGLRLEDIARQSLDVRNERATGTRMEMVGRSFVQAGSHTTGDFASILANIMGKAALKGWEEAEETYQLWTSKGVLTDFKATKRVGLGLLDALPEVVEGANYTYGTVGDRGEPIQLATYGRLLKVTRQTIINDDLSVLSTLPMKMGRAARRTIGNLCYAVLTGNPTMSDGKALFHADHNNLAGTGAAPSVATLGAARAAMKTQTQAAGGAALNISPRYFIVPAALETTANQLMASLVDPTATKGHATNPVAGMAEVIADGRLDAASATAWYLAANPAAFDTVEVAYLDGIETPYIEEKTSWSSDGAELKVRIDAGVAPLDFRTFYKNAGA